MGRTGPHKDPQLSPSAEKMAVGASCIRALCTRLRWYQSIAREPARHAHLLCCWLGRMHFEMHDTLIDGQRLDPGANGYAKRLLADLPALAFVPELAERTTNVEEDLGDVFRSGSKRNEWCTGLDLRQCRAVFFTQQVTLEWS